jgi:phytoene synthase
MKPPERHLDSGDLARCREILARGSKTFHAASRLLPARLRAPVTVLYAFCRVADDLVDGPPSGRDATSELGGRLDEVYEGRPREDAVDRALSVIVARHRIPRAFFDALVEGFVWDTSRRRYATLEDLYAYAARVAGTVGAMMTLVMGPRDPVTLARASDLGIAMQLTNIARDVGEDARHGRLYLPLGWFSEVGLDPEEWLASPCFNARIAAMTARLLAAADALYRRADTGIERLPPDCQLAIRAARLFYAEIGAYVAGAGFDSVTARRVVPTWRKAWLAVSALFPRRGTRSADEPALGAARFLLDVCAEDA